MNYKYYHVVDSNGFQIEFVLVVDGEIQHYTLKDGERLIDSQLSDGLLKPRWNGSEWIESATMEEVAATLPTINELKTAKKAEIANLRWQSQTVNITHDGNVYLADEAATSSIHAAVTAALSGNREWKTANGTSVKLNANKLQKLFVAIEERKESCFVKESALCAQIDNCQTAAEIAAIKWGD